MEYVMHAMRQNFGKTKYLLLMPIIKAVSPVKVFQMLPLAAF